MGTTNGLVIDEKILIAAGRLRNEDFTAEDLVVSAFKLFAEDFSLMGYPQYPDSNKVLTQITTAGRGLQKRGWLRKIGTKRYELTGEGRRHLLRLHQPGESSSNLGDRDIKDLIIHWIGTAAFRKVSLGAREEITEREALGWWRLTSASTAARANRELALADRTSAEIARALERGQPIRLRHDRVLPLEEARTVLDLSTYLKSTYRKEISFLQGQRR